MRPHRWQPTRLRRPWDSPGKNTGVGCHFLLQCMKVKSESEVAQSCLTQRPHGLQPTRLLRPWDFPGKSTGVECHCLLKSSPLGLPQKKADGSVKVEFQMNNYFLVQYAIFRTHTKKIILIRILNLTGHTILTCSIWKPFYFSWSSQNYNADLQ